MMPKTWFWCAVSLVLAVRLDSAGDVESWATYSINLNENRSLEQVVELTVTPQGDGLGVAGPATGSPGSAPVLIRREANTLSGGTHQ